MPILTQQGFDYQLDPAFPLERLAHRQHDQSIRSLHWHNVLEVGLCHAGVGVFVIDDRIQPFSPGCVVAIGPRRPHLARSRPGSSSRWTFLFLDTAGMFGPAWRPGGPDDASDLARLVPAGEASQLLAMALAEMERCEPGWQAATRSLLHAMLVGLARGAQPGRAMAATMPSDLAPAIERISRSYDGPLRMTELAAACRMSVATLRRRFHEQLGQSPGQYLMRYRVLVAGQLLREGLSVTQAAAAVGFADRGTLHRAFRATLGQPPARWRSSQ